MTPKRPASVPDSATVIYPGQTFYPGVGVQINTLTSIQRQVDHANSMADLTFARALSDWKTNAPIYAAYNLQGPPEPTKPKHGLLTLTYADVSGNEITDANVYGTGLAYCWVEEIYA